MADQHVVVKCANAKIEVETLLLDMGEIRIIFLIMDPVEEIVDESC